MLIKKISKNYLTAKLLQGLALALFANSIIIPHLTSVNYHPLSFEVLFFFSSIFVFFFIIGFFSYWSLFIIFSFLLTYWSLDSLFIEKKFLREILILCLLVFLKFWTLDRKLLPKITIIFSIVFISLSSFSFENRILLDEKIQSKYNNPLIKPKFSYLHIILDEHASLQLAPDQYNDEIFNKTFEKDYVSNNFKIYNKTFTYYPRTKSTLGSLFTLYHKEDKTITKYNFYYPNNRFSVSIIQNLYSHKLKNNGFKISYIQSNGVEICDKHTAHKCETYSRGSNMNLFEKYDLTYKERIEIALLNLHQYYYHKGKVVILYKKIIDIIKPDKPGYYGFYSRPLANLYILDEIHNRIKNIKEGEALIAHILLPHYPYVLDKDCNLKKTDDWTYPLRHKMNNKSSAYQGHYDQLQCTHKKMKSILKEAGKNDNLIVVIHGDHGARLFRNTKYSNKDDNLGTIVAIKDKFTNPMSVNEDVELQTIFVNFIKKNFIK